MEGKGREDSQQISKPSMELGEVVVVGGREGTQGTQRRAVLYSLELSDFEISDRTLISDLAK